MWYVLYEELECLNDVWGYRQKWKRFNLKREAYEWVQNNENVEVESIFYQVK